MDALLDLFAPLDHGFDPDDEDPVCVVVAEYDSHQVDLEVLDEWIDDSMRLIDSGGGRLAYYGVRHCLELGLKVALHVPGGGWTTGHDLDGLLVKLQTRSPDHPLFAEGNDEAAQLRHFIEEIHRRDPGGDEGRYARRRGGALAFTGDCHIPRYRLRLCLLLAQELLQPLPVG